MRRQERVIWEERWDNLIVLDACRYDAMAEEWRGGGSVEPVLSPASWTLEWLDRVFGRLRLRATVFSANPYISSRGEVRLHDIRWRASEHFSKIHDLWLTAWDSKLGTVPPEKVYLAVAASLGLRGAEGRLIVWFMQPHYPYLSPITMGEESTALRPQDFVEGRADRAARMIAARLASHGPEQLRRAYRDTLRRALSSVYRLLGRLEGRTIITSDHGELLGEHIALQAASTIINLASRIAEDHSTIYASRRIKAILSYLRGRRTGAPSYIHRGRVYLHPSALYSTTLRKVPLILVK